MRHPTVLALVAAGIAASSGTASAQSVRVETYRQNPYYYDGYNGRYDRTPRVYGYYRSDVEEPDVAVRIRPTSCGQYRYWNGERCADARVAPPDLN